jgi:hypothetical protein
MSQSNAKLAVALKAYQQRDEGTQRSLRHAVRRLAGQ